MSSPDTTTIAVHRALHEALNSAREAKRLLDDGEARPDLDDMVALGTMVAAISENVLAINATMAARTRMARGSLPGTHGVTGKSGVRLPRRGVADPWPTGRFCRDWLAQLTLGSAH